MIYISDMMVTTFTIAQLPPPGPEAKLELPHPETDSNPTIFNDAIAVRRLVFVDEQHCSADAEIDADDARSWHWVLYDSSTTSNSNPTPVGVIRLVPPPQPPHGLLTQPVTAQILPPYDWVHEPCIKLTRVAILTAYRGQGLARRLVETTLAWAAGHAEEIDAAATQLARKDGDTRRVRPWQGLVLVHAQVEVERMYVGLGFYTDETLGRWDEEGIEHVGMFRRIEVVR